MSQTPIKQSDQTFKQPPPNNPQNPNQQRPMPPFMEQKIKEIVMDTLIELNLIPKAEKTKRLSDV